MNRALAVVIDSVPERWMHGLNGKLSQFAHWRSGVPQQVAALQSACAAPERSGLFDGVVGPTDD